MANLGSVAKIGLSIEIDFSVSAIATVRKPSLRNSLGEPSNQVHGIRKTEPIETLTARRFNGSQELRVNNIASIPKAAAERKMAPILVASTTPSMTTIRRAFRHTSSALGSARRRMAQRTPRVSVYPVNVASNFLSPV